MKLHQVALIVFLTIGVVACQSEKVEKADLETTKDKVSYAIGLDIGKNMRSQTIEVDPKIFLKGLMDGIEDAEALMNEEELTETMMAFQMELQAKQNEKQKEESEKNMKAGSDFIEEYKKKEGVVVLESGLQYRVIKSGDGPSPKATDNVTTHYSGKLVDGTKFDSSYDRGEPATFPLNGVIPGWTEILQKMKVGDKWEVVIPANLGYGEQGAGNVIPPNSTLIFEIELLGIN